MRTGFVSIRTKLLALFMVFNVIPMGFVATHLYRQAENQIRTSTLQHLKELNELKAREIDQFFDRARLNLISAQNFVVFRSNIPILIRLADRTSDPRFITAKRLLDIQLIKFAADHHIADIDIIGLDGHVVYSIDTGHPDDESHADDLYFTKGKKGIYFSDIYRTDKNGSHCFLLASAPLYDLDDRLIGVVACEIETDSLFTLIRGSMGLGRSGVTLLGKKDGGAIVFLNPLRHDPDAALRKRIRIGDTVAVPIQLAACGVNGSGLSCDYRGAKVVSAWNYIPTLKWGIVTKIDASEAFAPIIELRRDMLTAGAIALVLGTIISLALAHSMAKPIRALKEGAEQLGLGNLDHRIPVTSNDEFGSLSNAFNRMVINLKEITESHARVHHQANHDSLTGLPNRLLLEDRLGHALREAKREGKMLGLMFLDLDGFKGVNDTYGHDVGDILLKQVADRLCYCVRQSDTVARIGGDEFLLVLPDVYRDADVAEVANRVAAEIREPIRVDDLLLHTSASIGVCHYPVDGRTQDDLMRVTDQAMYQAKRQARGTIYRVGEQLGG
jgi:diguanylate cyclase (GGDEF)-like protein